MKFQTNKLTETPHGNSTIWRYMSHWKLKNLLEGSALFFPNAIKLSDQYEVSIPESTTQTKCNELKRQGVKSRDLHDELSTFYWENNPMKDLVLINCWSISPYESYALWKIYLGGENNGIAIKSTISKLRKSIQNGNDQYPEDFFIGKVKYKSYLKLDELARHTIITTKKPFYDFEKELRVYIMNYPQTEGGFVPHYDIKVGRSVKVNLQTMIHNIYISPFADSGYIKEVGNLFKNANFEVNLLRQSEIKDQ